MNTLKTSDYITTIEQMVSAFERLDLCLKAGDSGIGLVGDEIEALQACRALLEELKWKEPVAWRTKRNGAWSYHANEVHGVPNERLYTNPQQRTWVGLTEKEIEKMRHLIDWTAHWSYGTFAKAIEAKLKEKNTK